MLGRVGSYCGSVRYCDSDVWVTDNALVCRAKNPDETRYWYYALQTCRLNEHRAGSGQPLLNQRILRDVAVLDVTANERRPIGELLGALDDKIAANGRVIEAAEALMVATVESVSTTCRCRSLASRSSAVLEPGEFARHGRAFQLFGVRRRRMARACRCPDRSRAASSAAGAVCAVSQAQPANPADLERRQSARRNGLGECGVRRAAATRRRYVGAVGGAASNLASQRRCDSSVAGTSGSRQRIQAA